MDTFAEKAKRMGYEVKLYNSDKRIYRIGKGEKSFITVGMHFPFNSIVGYNLAKRKDLTKRLLKDAGFSVPNGILTSDFKEIVQAIRNNKLQLPLVTKPDNALKGKMVAAKINTIKELEENFDRVNKHYGRVLVEEFCEGEDYRILVLDGKVLAIAHRIPPYIIGDGISRISELIDIYNNERPNPLILNYEVDRLLEKQHFTLESIPQSDQKVILRGNANASTGGMIEDATKLAHPSFKEIAINATKVLGLRFCGVDMMLKDISDPKSGYKIIELNSDPGYDLHWEVEVGEKYDATEKILRALLG